MLPRTKLGPHRRHVFQLENVDGKQYSHAKLTIYPDGGVKRLRLYGRLDLTGAPATAPAEKSDTAEPSKEANRSASPAGASIPALWLTPEAFAPFGHVVQAWADIHAVPKGIKTTPANQGTATKFHKLAPVLSSYAADAHASTGISVYRAGVTTGAVPGQDFCVRLLERHPCTNQAFIPMGTGGGIGEDAIAGQPARAYLVVVSLNGTDDKPDVSTMRAFVATTAQGIVYGAGIWRKSSSLLETLRLTAALQTIL